jgi:hypothetical protein
MIVNPKTVVVTYDDLNIDAIRKKKKINEVSIHDFSFKLSRNDVRKYEIIIYVDENLNSKILKNRWGN